MLFSIIVATARNRVIGKDNALPWHLPADLKYFKATTMGKPIVMGRKTFESIGRPLPGRQNIVLTRDPNWSAEGVTVINDVNDMTRSITVADEVMIIGGEQIYDLTMNHVDRLYVTEVECDVDGDAYFPAIDNAVWQEASRERHAADERNPAYSFVVYKRCAATAD
ncbi:dihydrofolate reductase [Kordiimonas aquimaris]|uniref:dihydrofolate reductase n=1 Tax=Kordiimonas aquimaris TaxID=707591 RepID=UPI0021D27ACE|nr:dihydrofolate reductase [Kordiimonas aquimaris]